MIRIPGKIPIIIHPLFWLIALFIGWMSSFSLGGTLLAVIVIFISVLIHEYGHALTAIAFGQKTRIELAVFGGFTYREGRKLKLWEEFFVVLNGPIAGLCLFGVAWLVARYVPVMEGGAVAFMLKFAILVNLFWTIINLVPVLPLDGGHLLSIILEGILGFKGVKLAIIIGLVIAVGISIFFFAIGAFLIGALFLILTFESFRSLRYYKLLKEQDRDDGLQTLARAAEVDYKEGRLSEALEKFEQVRERAKEGILYTMSTQEIAAIYNKQNKYEEAYSLLLPLQKTLSGEALSLFHTLAYRNRDYNKVIEVGNQCYQIDPSPNTALINALAFGSQGKTEPSLGWLDCAIREGLSHITEVLSHPEFDPVRSSSGFQQLMHKYT